MRIGTKSAYSFTSFYTDNEGKRTLTERVPFKYREFSDTQRHEVVQGDNWWNLAGRYFEGFTKRNAGLWWVIFDFQPIPRLDHLLKLEAGEIIYIPSIRVLNEYIFVEDRVGEG